MERNTFAPTSEEAFQDERSSRTGAFTFSFFRRIVNSLSAVASPRTFEGARTAPEVAQDTSDTQPAGSGCTGRVTAGANSAALSDDGSATTLYSLRQAVQNLKLLLSMREGDLDACDILYVINLHSSLESQLAQELERFYGLPMVTRYEDGRSRWTAALVEGLLKVYCDALSHPPVEWHGIAGDAEAGVVAVRAAEAARILAMFSWVRLEEPPPIVWQALAAACGKIRNQISNAVDSGSVREGMSAVDIVDTTFFRLVLLLLADPFSMQSAEIIAADQLIASCLRTVSFEDGQSQAVEVSDPEAGISRPWDMSGIASGWGGGMRISVNQVVADVLAQLDVRRSVNGMPDFPSGTPELPRMLARRWMAFPSHPRAQRTKVFIQSRMILGALSLIQAEKLGMSSGIETNALQRGKVCILVDRSDSGCRVRFSGATYLNLVPGVLIGIELPFGQGRSVGVIRWVRRSADLSAEIGVCLLAEKVEPVPLKRLAGCWTGGGAVEFGLLAFDNPEKTYQTDVDILLLRSKVPEEDLGILKVVNAGTYFRVQKVLETGHDFLRVRASMVMDEIHAETGFASSSSEQVI